MRRKQLLALLLLAMVSLLVTARTKTTQYGLRDDAAPVENMADEPGDSVANFDTHAVTLRGFTKRASDTKETFFVTNNTKHRISHVNLLLRYRTLDGEQLHEREVTVNVNVGPGETRLASVTSFDRQRMFYYYNGPRPRKSATPFKVSFRLLGYDIPVGQVAQ